MYKYKGYTIQRRKSNEVFIRNNYGKIICECETELAAEEYIDNLTDIHLPEDNLASEENLWYVYRICGRDPSAYNNCQYYDGNTFKYNSANAKYFTEDQAETIAKTFLDKTGDYYEYFISRKSDI